MIIIFGKGKDMPYSKMGTQRIPLSDARKAEIEREEIFDELEEDFEDELEEDFEDEFGG